jgi:hypothetical protein
MVCPVSWTEAPALGGPLQGMLSEYVAMPADWCVWAQNSLTATEANAANRGSDSMDGPDRTWASACGLALQL